MKTHRKKTQVRPKFIEWLFDLLLKDTKIIHFEFIVVYSTTHWGSKAKNI